MGKERKSLAAPITIAAVMIVALLPFAYFLSFGPLLWLHEAGYINVNGGFGEAYAWPLNRISEFTPRLRTLMINYLALWSPPKQ